MKLRRFRFERVETQSLEPRSGQVSDKLHQHRLLWMGCGEEDEGLDPIRIPISLSSSQKTQSKRFTPITLIAGTDDLERSFMPELVPVSNRDQRDDFFQSPRLRPGATRLTIDLDLVCFEPRDRIVREGDFDTGFADQRLLKTQHLIRKLLQASREF